MADVPRPRRARRPRPVEESTPEEPEEKAIPELPPAVLAEMEEKAPRRILLGGMTLLLAGLALVGTTGTGPGSAVTLVGLAVTIYGIHTFGRLGPAEPASATAADVARAAAKQRLVAGIVVTVVGLGVAVAASLGFAPDGSRDVAVVALLVGAIQGIRAAMALTPSKTARAKG